MSSMFGSVGGWFSATADARINRTCARSTTRAMVFVDALPARHAVAKERSIEANDADMDEIRNLADSCRGRRPRLTERALTNAGKLILLNCFTSFRTRRTGKELVDELAGRFGEDCEEIPEGMCPLGNRRATLRRFLVARKYVWITPRPRWRGDGVA